MRCLIVIPSLKRSGAETQAVELANGLAGKGHQVHLCSFEPELHQRDRLADAIRFHHVARKARYDLSLTARIAEVIDREGIEIVQGILQFAVLVAWMAARRSVRKPPVVAGVHTTINRGLKQELQDRLLYRWILASLPAIVFVCNYQRDHWIRKFPDLQSLARVVHNGVDLNRFRRDEFQEAARRLRKELGIPSNAFVFACIAAFRPEKGHRLLIEAFAQLPTDTYLILAGDGSELKTIEFIVQNSGISSRVRFLGNVADVRPVIVASDATVLTSTAVETFSMAMLESMALEVPMIAARIGGLPEAIIQGETGLLFPIGDVNALRSGMKEMTGMGAQVRAMGHAAGEKIRTSYTFSAMTDRSECVLNDVLSQHLDG